MRLPYAPSQLRGFLRTPRMTPDHVPFHSPSFGGVMLRRPRAIHWPPLMAHWFTLAVVLLMGVGFQRIASAAAPVFQGTFTSPTLCSPRGIALSSGDVLVGSDCNAMHMERFTAGGAFQFSLPFPSGFQGSPNGLAVDGSDRIFVTDTDGRRIYKLTNSGALLSSWTTAVQPVDVAVNASGEVFVSNNNGQRLQKFTNDGVFLANIGSAGAGPGQYLRPDGIAIDASGRIYVSDAGAGTHHVLRFLPNGSFDMEINTPVTPTDVAVGPDGNVYVISFSSSVAYQYSPSGILLHTFSSPTGLDGPDRIAISPAGAIFITEENVSSNRITKFQIPGLVCTFSLSVGVNDASLGYTDQSAGTCHAAGDTVTVTAIPYAGCRFTQWQGDLTGNANPQSIIMDGNKSALAIFEVIPPCEGLLSLSVSVNDANLGHVDQSPAGPCRAPGDVVTLTAVPASGCLFVAWQGDLTGNTNPQSITMDGNKSVLATFEVAPPPACQQWTDLSPSPGPIKRSGAASIWDPIRRRMIMFGGNDGSQLRRDLIVLDATVGSSSWVPLAVSSTPYLPAPRDGANAIYDPVRDRLILFGGRQGSFFNDVWTLSLSGTPTWAELVDPTPPDPAGPAPLPRFLSSAIYDPVRDRMLVFGGMSDDHQFHNDVWALPLSGAPTWTKLTTSVLLPSGTRT